jgi:hypothetical protein
MERTRKVPIYLDWSLWTVLIALSAVVLSQIPPLYQVFGRAKITLDVYSKISISQKVGNPNIQLHTIFTNIGGRSVRIKEINLQLRRDGKDLIVLPAMGFLQQSSDKNAVLFAGFRIGAKEEWAHIVNFFNLFPHEREKEYKAAELALQTDISFKRQLPENKNRLAVANPIFVAPIRKYFEENFIWLPGEYELVISASSSEGKLLVSKKYRFTLFESDSNELRKALDDLKYGDGTYWDSGKYPGVIVQLVEA